MRKVRVLLVEDAMDQALLLQTFLRTAGPYEVTHAQDGARAIELLDRNEYDVLITDLNLPGKDGFEVLRHLRSQRPDTAALAVTGYRDPSFGEEALRAGASALLHKPLDRDDFLEKVGVLLPPRLFEAETAKGPVLAVGARPGDVEVGCGATLAGHAAEGRDVVIVLLDRHLEPGGADAAEAAQRSAEHLGARVVLADAAVGPGGGPAELQIFVSRMADELGPAVAYVPAPNDRDTPRAVAGRLGASALATTPVLLGYLTATSAADARPDRIVPVDDQMAHKAEALIYYQGSGVRRKDLTAEYVEEQARRWRTEPGGREAEPFVVLSEKAARGTA